MRFVLPNIADVTIPAAGGICSYLWPKWINTHKHTSYSNSSFQTRIPWAQKQTDRRIQTDETESPMWSRSIESRKNLALTALKINQPLIFYYYYNLLTLLWCDSLVLRVVRLNRGVFGFTCSPSRGYGERWGWDGNETEGDRWRDDDVTHMWQDGAALLVQREKHSNHQLTHTHTHRHCPDTHHDDWQEHQPRVWTQSQEKYFFSKQSGLIPFHERGTNEDKRISKPALVELNRPMQLFAN